MATENIKVLVLADHATRISGPHNNVVGSLNALAARDDVELRLLCGKIDNSEYYAYSGRTDIRLGFHPHSGRRLLTNVLKVQQSLKGRDIVYIPTGRTRFG